jgi:hypothetical protein
MRRIRILPFHRAYEIWVGLEVCGKIEMGYDEWYFRSYDGYDWTLEELAIIYDKVRLLNESQE